MLVSQINETATMLVYQTNPVSHLKTFYSKLFAWLLAGHKVETLNKLQEVG